MNTLTSKKNLSKRLPHTPSAATSSLALGVVLADRWVSSSPDSSYRRGSMDTSRQTSDKKEAVMSLISLYLNDGYPPMGQDNK